ncbi:PREDICTED: probable 18S rRNA (guanine-N(7))-methyltransferase isoform X2 [Ceratosolen solmsi marchali]|nr:PREDICTED: probable 18S rRNA (guanine-N(7))-methyltransferase isoform X2 [Ceratosolen solmsi marchali]XP_011503693.1 PREDICTED: probable 18S rRNA (guanine-N(7))-methyltransferase isoform X2 [Ceratosolen solmsi marchali]
MRMSERAFELLLLPKDKVCLLLDIGCGSGLSGSVLENKGHYWLGIDISSAMLNIGVHRKIIGDTMLVDMGQGMPFKTASFDGAISISALQWLCNIDNNKYVLRKRLDIFFSTLFATLSRSARAVFQFYPENDDQINIITTAATRAGFFGGIMIDFPNSKSAKKVFLVIMTSTSMISPEYSRKDHVITKTLTTRKRTNKTMITKLRKNRILEKKERNRRKGKFVKTDSKYSGRKRKNQF